MLNTYKVIVIGTNIILSDSLRKSLGSTFRKVASLGFATTRIVIANDADMAREMAVADARTALMNELAGPVENDSADPPHFTVDDIEMLEAPETYKGPKTGFTFFPDRKLP